MVSCLTIGRTLGAAQLFSLSQRMLSATRTPEPCAYCGAPVSIVQKHGPSRGGLPGWAEADEGVRQRSLCNQRSQ